LIHFGAQPRDGTAGVPHPPLGAFRAPGRPAKSPELESLPSL